MKASTDVLAQLNKEVGGVEGVDAVMDNLREERERVEEITGVLGESAAEGVDEGEVEQELEEMMRSEGVKQEPERQQEPAREALFMPDVPAAEPGLGSRAGESDGDDVSKRLSSMSLDESPHASSGTLGKEIERHDTAEAQQETA